MDQTTPLLKPITGLLIALFGFLPWGAFPQGTTPGKPCLPCQQLLKLSIPDVTVLEAKSISKDTIDGQVITVPFCKVVGRISKEINFELLLPNSWNERFLMSGGGGFVGTIANYLRSEVNGGYATAGTDTGHTGDGVDASWALNDMERQLNFGKLAIHRTAVVAKWIIQAYYCSPSKYSYFLGCSRGGGQGMMEAQQYPDDFNGIVAGAPAFSWPAIGAKFVAESRKNYPDPNNLTKPVITPDNLRLLQEQILKQCDALDGVTDTILNDPRACPFKLSSLPLCPDNQPGPNCMTTQQLEAIKSIYSPVAVDQEIVYPGFPFGGENERGNWDIWIAGNNPSVPFPSLHYGFGTNMYKYLIFNDPKWDYSHYTMNTFANDTRYASSYLDATQTDYSGLKKAGGKMILYHGWSDAALSAYQTINHYQAVEQIDKNVQSYLRLFLLPGVLHCGGGPGPDDVNWINLIRDWVEQGKVPERVVISKVEAGKTTMTRPVFPYPKVAVYSGTGDTNLEKNFSSK